MESPSVKTNSSSQTKSIVVIVILLSSLFFGPIAYAVGVGLMWKMTNWSKWLKIVISLPLAVLFLLSLFVIIYLFVAKPVHMVGQTMLPTYKEGEYLLTKPLYNTKIIRGDIVIFSPPNNPNVDYIKRVIAIPGDQIEIKNSNVYLNNLLLKESYLSEGMKTNLWVNGFLKERQVLTIPNDQYFVMGDNRPKSSDSRQFGLVSKKIIQSKVMFCYWNCK